MKRTLALLILLCGILSISCSKVSEQRSETEGILLGEWYLRQSSVRYSYPDDANHTVYTNSSTYTIEDSKIFLEFRQDGILLYRDEELEKIFHWSVSGNEINIESDIRGDSQISLLGNTKLNWKTDLSDEHEDFHSDRTFEKIQ